MMRTVSGARCRTRDRNWMPSMPRHLAVGHDDRERPALGEVLQRGLAALGGFDRELAAETAFARRQQIRVVVHE